MPTITVHPEALDGPRALARIEFEQACEAQDVARLRELLELEDRIAWDPDGEGAEDWDHPKEARVSGELLDKLVRTAWELGNEKVASHYSCRADASRTLPEGYPERNEREARAMLAFHEHVQDQRVAS